MLLNTRQNYKFDIRSEIAASDDLLMAELPKMNCFLSQKINSTSIIFLEDYPVI